MPRIAGSDALPSRRAVMSRSPTLYEKGLAPVFLLALLALGCTPAADPTAVEEIEPAGAVLIEAIERGSPLAAAGLAVGDRLVEWSRGDVRGPFDSWDELQRLEIEQAPLGPVRVEVERAGRRIVVELAEDRWRARARPALAPQALALHRRAVAALASHDLAAARALVQSLAGLLFSPSDRAWCETRLAALLRALPETESGAWERALDAARSAEDPALELWIATERCAAGLRSGRLVEARAACERARSLDTGPASPLARLHVSYLEAGLAGRAGDPREEERRYREVLAALQPIAADSLLTSRALRGLAKARASQDDPAGAVELAGRALALVERRAPGSLEHQNVLMNLAIFHWYRSEWPEAEARLAQARAILEAIDPDHEEMANVLGNLAMVAADRGDLGFAEETHLESLAFRARRGADPLQDSRTYNNLATIAARRGDFATALRYDRQALTPRELLGPDSLDLVIPLHNLGEHSRRAGDHAAAVGFLERALAIQRRHAPGSQSEAATLVALGEALEAAADSRAPAILEEATALAERAAPDSVVAAAALRALGSSLSARGELAAAEEALGRAAAIYGRLTPGTAYEAQALFDLGRVRRRAGRGAEALAPLTAAVEALDRQLSTFGSTDEVRARFRESWRHLFDELADLLRELGRPEEAFEVLERARSRAFLALLRARRIDLTAGLPADLAAERAAILESHEEIERRLATPESVRDPASARELRARRRELQQRRDRLAERVGRWSPRLAGLESVLGVEAARAALGDATTAISYSVDEQRTLAWIVGPAGQFEIIDLGVGEDELRDLVDRYRSLLESRSSAADPEPLGSRLYQLLVEPIAGLVRTPALVLVPDGPLHHLPFAALVVPALGGESGPGGRPRFLAEWKPLQIAGSLTAWAELRRRSAASGGTLAAFADPSPFPAARAGVAESARWRRLPHGRREAERVTELFGRDARSYLGVAATEREVKRIASGVRYLHFATHAFVDPLSPLDSALVLAPGVDDRGRREDGLLQGWEVLQELELDGGLVVLSGCDTGGGALVADEGILGLTRAFHFAGARAVVASLWPVGDRETGELMEQVYRELAAGRSADEALRAAQLALLARAATAHPSAWAAFQLHGAR